MKRVKLTVFIVLLFTMVYASDHGIYMKVVKNVKTDFNSSRSMVKEKLAESGYTILNDFEVATPSLVREDKDERTSYKAAVLLLESHEYTKMLTSFGNKYLVAGFFRVGIYEDPTGFHIQIIDPETINRVIFNDLSDEEYIKVVRQTLPFKKNLIDAIHSLNLGDNLSENMEPIRDDEDLREASKDMFMMVGPMTFFLDEDQFPVIYTRRTENPGQELEKLLGEIKTNLKNYQPLEDDAEYNWSANGKKDLSWKIVGKVYSPDSMALVLGITRPRTEALSFHIAGNARMDDENKSPGLDHVSAYPVEVLLIAGKGEVKVMTQREMFRMDMYFWDAGKMAFMSYKNMPGMLDESIRKALLNIDED